MAITWSKKITVAEGLTFGISMIAVVISVFSAIEARHATLQARRSEVRAALQSSIQNGSASFAQALCTLRVTDSQTASWHARYAEAIARMEKTARNLNSLRASSDAIQNAGDSGLTRIELQAEQMDGTLNDLRGEMASLKTLLSKEEIERVNSVCGSL